MSQPLNKITAERNQRALLELATKPGNDVCADCKARYPRWASHNIGIFICVNCASIHRKIGTHVTKVKSLTLDSWSKEQVENMKQNGNIKSNDLYNPDEIRHPPPTNMIESERDSELEKYIRAKYEYKKFINRPALVATYLGPPRSISGDLSSRPRSTPITDSAPPPSSSPIPPSNIPERRSANAEPAKTLSAITQSRSTSQPVSSHVPQGTAKPNTTVWDDLVSLHTSDISNSSLPLQYQSNDITTTMLPGQSFVDPGANSNRNLQLNSNPYTGSSYLQPPTAPVNTFQGGGMDMFNRSPTGMQMSAQGPFQHIQMQQQPQQQQHVFHSTTPTLIQAGSNAPSHFGQVYTPTALSAGFGGNMGMSGMTTGMSLPQSAPPPQPSPSFQHQISGYLQPPMSYPQPSATFQQQAFGQPNQSYHTQPFPTQSQTLPQQQAFPLQANFMQPSSPFPQQQQTQQMQMFAQTSQFGSWPQEQQQQGGYPGHQWGGI